MSPETPKMIPAAAILVLVTRYASVGGDTLSPMSIAGHPVAVTPRTAADTSRHRAIEYSDAYGTRLRIHRYVSYAVIPVFAAEYLLGNKLIADQHNGRLSSDQVKSNHTLAAGAIAGLFTVNTATGLWNLWDARHDPNGRTRRITHTVMMLTADAGFVATGVLASGAKDGDGGAAAHRNVALGSMGLTAVGGLMMKFWKD